VRLSGRHPAIGIKNDDSHVGSLVESRSDGGPCVARGCDNDGEWTGVGAGQSLQAGSKKARTDVLERGRRAMEQLELEKLVPLDRYQRRLEIESLCAEGGQVTQQFIAFEEWRQQGHANLGERLRPVEARKLEAWHGLRYVKSPVGRESGRERWTDAD